VDRLEEVLVLLAGEARASSAPAAQAR
jgi:hypothetical protein